MLRPGWSALLRVTLLAESRPELNLRLSTKSRRSDGLTGRSHRSAPCRDAWHAEVDHTACGAVRADPFDLALVLPPAVVNCDVSVYSLVMSSTAGRFGLTLAPGGLRLAQELVNTALDELEDAEDQLAEPAAANAWLGDALARWAEATGRSVPDLTLGEDDLPSLRRLRERLRQTTRAQAEHLEPPSVAPVEKLMLDIRLGLEPDGGVEYVPVEQGWRGLGALVAMELLLARSNGTLSRLKSCAGTTCGVSFYDESRNQARVWHDSKVCGNAPNLRASRARRKNKQ
jgi:hypothetical protein